MRTAKGWLLLAAALSAFLGFAPSLFAQEEDAQRTAFERQLERVRKRMEQGGWESARKQLESALREHAEAPYVIAHLGELELALKRCEFWKGRAKFDPRSVLKGKVLAFDAGKGRLEVQYAEDRPHDFERAGLALLLPIEFSGPYEVELSEGPSPTVVVCVAGQESIQVSFGQVFNLGVGNPAHKKPTQRWVKVSTRLRGKDGEIEQVDKEKDFTSRRKLDREVFEVRVTGTQVKTYFNGKSLLSVSKPRDLWGSLALPPGGPHGLVRIEGDATGWAQRQRDEEYRDEWKEFEKSWKLADHVPAWLAAAVAKAPAADPATTGHGMPAGAAREDIEEWNRAVEALEGGYYSDAIAAVDRLAAREVEFGEVLLVRATALRGLRRTEDALVVLRSCIERFPDYRDARHDLARTLLVNGRFEEALIAVSAAIEAGVPPMELQPISITANKALHGPAWSGKSVFSSRHYTVGSDLDERICRTVALELEETFRHVSRRLGFGEHVEGKKFQVYVFSGEASYLDYIEDVFEGRGENTLGMYSPYLKQLLILDSPRRADVMHTVRHEGFHQFLDAELPAPPLWLNEGLAEYFAAARTASGSWRDGQLEHRRLEVLRTPTPGRPRLQQRLTPLRRFLYQDHASFMRSATYSYAQAWAFVHYLRHSSRQNQDRLKRLIDELRAGVPNREAIDLAFEGCDLDTLDSEFHEFLAKL